MPTIDTNEMIVFNNIVTQLKQIKDKITPEEWNTMWNIIVAQSNQNAEALRSLRNFVAGENVGVLELPDGYSTLIEYVTHGISNVLISSEDEPVDVNFYIKLEP